MSASQVDLDAKTLVALASSNRLCMLQVLKMKKMNLTDLSKTLDRPKSSTHRDLNILIKSGLINKISSPHKWCYYKLTHKGDKLFSDESKKTIIITDDIPYSSSYSALSSISTFADPARQIHSGRRRRK